jgi:hypothetical protein
MIEIEFWFTQFGVRIKELCLTGDPTRFGRTYQPPPINTKIYQMPLHLE